LLKPPAIGSVTWSEKVLASFDITNGSEPAAGLFLDSSGARNAGTIFKVKTR
jgi:hypothetical protein